MKRIFVWLIVVALIVTGFLLYQSRPRTNLNVTPDAEREIERAKRR